LTAQLDFPSSYDKAARVAGDFVLWLTTPCRFESCPYSNIAKLASNWRDMIHNYEWKHRLQFGLLFEYIDGELVCGHLKAERVDETDLDEVLNGIMRNAPKPTPSSTKEVIKKSAEDCIW